IGRELAEYNPVERTTKYDSQSIERCLTPAELAVVWNAATPDSQFGRIVRQLILTGARREQIGGLLKAEGTREKCMMELSRIRSLKDRRRSATQGVELKRRRGCGKNNTKFQIPLSDQSLALLDMEVSPPDTEYFFGNGKGEGGFSGWSNSMAGLYEAIGDRIE